MPDAVDDVLPVTRNDDDLHPRGRSTAEHCSETTEQTFPPPSLHSKFHTCFVKDRPVSDDTFEEQLLLLKFSPPDSRYSSHLVALGATTAVLVLVPTSCDLLNDSCRDPSLGNKSLGAKSFLFTL